MAYLHREHLEYKNCPLYFYRTTRGWARVNTSSGTIITCGGGAVIFQTYIIIKTHNIVVMKLTRHINRLLTFCGKQLPKPPQAFLNTISKIYFSYLLSIYVIPNYTHTTQKYYFIRIYSLSSHFLTRYENLIYIHVLNP